VKLPMDIRDIARASERARTEREQLVRIAVLIEPDAPEDLVSAARERLRPASSGAQLQVEVYAPGTRISLIPEVDAVVALVGSASTGFGEALADARAEYVPVAALALGHDRDVASRRLSHPTLDTLADEDADDLVARDLGAWLVDRLSGKKLALAHNFAFMRRSVAEESVKVTAFQNGVIGVVAFVPGADLPLMTANQAKMLLQIAAAYGEPLGAERVKELLAVVGGAFALRAFARQLLGFVPGVGWAIKGGIGYAGTVAMGATAIAYFEHGADLSEVVHHATVARDRAMAEARARLRRGEQPALQTGVQDSTGADQRAVAAVEGAEASDGVLSAGEEATESSGD